MKLKFVALSLLTAISLAYADSTNTPVQHLLWKQDILSIQIPLHQEKIIEICSAQSTPDHCNPVPLTPYLPQDEIAKGTLQSINNAGMIYLTATQAFENKLAEFKLNDPRGTVVLVRLTASETANADHLEILLPPEPGTANSEKSPGTADQTLSDKIRWVAEQLYAPKRLLTEPNWIRRVPMRTEKFVRIYKDAEVSAMPLASWQAGDEFITAVLLRNNQSHQAIALNFNGLRGQWIAASFFREGKVNSYWLTPARDPNDTTTLIVVSRLPFAEALKADESFPAKE
jgi:integrating conjugative element protein (TIGR03749 family)